MAPFESSWNATIWPGTNEIDAVPVYLAQHRSTPAEQPAPAEDQRLVRAQAVMDARFRSVAPNKFDDLSPAESNERDALRVVNAARDAMNESTDHGNTIGVPSHLASALSLALDDYDALTTRAPQAAPAPAEPN